MSPREYGVGLAEAGAMIRAVWGPAAAVSFAPGLGAALGGWTWSAHASQDASVGGGGLALAPVFHVDAPLRVRLGGGHALFVSPGATLMLTALTGGGTAHDASNGLGWFDLVGKAPRDFFGAGAPHVAATLDVGHALAF